MRCINACYKSISITNETLVLLVTVVYQLTSMNEKKSSKYFAGKKLRVFLHILYFDVTF